MNRKWITFIKHIGWAFLVILCVLAYRPIHIIAQQDWFNRPVNWFSRFDIDERFLPDYPFVERALLTKYPNFQPRNNTEFTDLAFKHDGLEINIHQLTSYESSETSSLLILGYMEVYNPTDQPILFDKNMITVTSAIDGPMYDNNQALYPLSNGYIYDVLSRNNNKILPGETVEGYILWRLPPNQAQNARLRQVIYFKNRINRDLSSQPTIMAYPLNERKYQQLVDNATTINDLLNGIYLGEKNSINLLPVNSSGESGSILWQVNQMEHYQLFLRQSHLPLKANRTYYLVSMEWEATNRASYGVNVAINHQHLMDKERQISPLDWQTLLETRASAFKMPVHEYIGPGQTIQWTETYLLPELYSKEELAQLTLNKQGIITYIPSANESVKGVNYLNINLPIIEISE